MRERKTHKVEGEEDEPRGDDTKGLAGASGGGGEEDAARRAVSAIQSAASMIVSRDAAKASSDPANSSGGATAGIVVEGAAKDPLDKVSSAISAINSRLNKAGQMRTGKPIDNKGPDAGAFHATLEINDFPQKARWAVTNRTNVAKILEATGTSITTKGTHYPVGKEVPTGGDPKLYILIEGDTEVVVGAALAELTRLLREATIAAVDADSRAPVSGRYTVT